MAPSGALDPMKSRDTPLGEGRIGREASVIGVA
jgi:hypothetical protein